MIRVAVAGAMGRMGRCLLELATTDERFAVAAALTEPQDRAIGTTLHIGDAVITVRDRLETVCDVLIDFTAASGTIAWLEVCERLGVPMVTGATGHDDKQRARLREGAKVIPIVTAPNFSVGIHLMRSIIGRIASQLGDPFDIEIVETHHRHKVDAPSGTALALFDALARAKGLPRESAAVFGRGGRVGERPKGQIGVHAVRMGEIVGQHEVHFSGPGETLTVRHTAHSRDTFASGALRAAAWVVSQSPGLYTLDDVVA